MLVIHVSSVLGCHHMWILNDHWPFFREVSGQETSFGVWYNY